MTNQQYVIRASQMKGLSLIKPVRGNPGILAYNYNTKVNGIFPCVIDATTWDQARKQIDAYFMAEANSN